MSSLNSVVNKLVRAAASVSTEISDADLDAHVARILAEEAKANDNKWSELGLGAYLKREQGRDSPDPNAPKPNKRFLSSIIRQVDGHNTALLRQQAQAAREVRQAREPPESRDAPRRRVEGKAGANRLFGGALKGLAEGRERRGKGASDRGRGRDAASEERELNDGERVRDRSRGRERDRDRRERRGDDDRDRRRHRDPSSSRSPPRRRHHSDGADDRKHRRRYDSDSDDHRERRREMEREKDLSRDRRRRDDDRIDRRDRSRSRSRDRIHRKERSRSHDRHNRHDNRKERKRERKHRDRSESPRRPAPPARARRTPRDTEDKPREPSASPPPPPSTISRMDRYFKRDYDPRLDVGEVPKTGPVTAVGWDNMLAVLKDRGKKRRRNSPTLSSSPEPERKVRPSGLPLKPEYRPTGLSAMPGDSSMSGEMSSLMEMEYTRRGQTRAWDVGKDAEKSD